MKRSLADASNMKGLVHVCECALQTYRGDFLKDTAVCVFHGYSIEIYEFETVAISFQRIVHVLLVII